MSIIHCIETLHKLSFCILLYNQLWFVFLQDVLIPEVQKLKQSIKQANM